MIGSSLAGKRIFITGATGFIGEYVAVAASNRGAKVIALERTAGKGAHLAELGIAVVRGDITDQSRMAEVFQRDITDVIHIAAVLSGVPKSVFHAVNVNATCGLAQLAAAADVDSFVYTSSIAVYGNFGDQDVDETWPLALYGDPYGDSKIRSELALIEICKETGLSYSIVRPGLVYGPKSPAWAIRLAKWAKAGRMPIIDGGAGLAYPVYIDNLVDLILTCVLHPAAHSQVFNGVDNGPTTLAEFLMPFLDMADTRRALRLPTSMARLGALVLNPFIPTRDLPYLVGQMLGKGEINNEKSKEVLGWQPKIDLEQGLGRTEAWLKEAGYL